MGSSSIMVSDFIDEVGGFLEIGGMKQRPTLEHQKDGYFTNDQFVIGRTDREQIRSRINNNDCRTFRPRRPLSTAYRTKETAV